MLENRNNQKWDGNKAPRSFPRSWKQKAWRNHTNANLAILASFVESTVHYSRVLWHQQASYDTTYTSGVLRARTWWLWRAWRGLARFGQCCGSQSNDARAWKRASSGLPRLLYGSCSTV